MNAEEFRQGIREAWARHKEQVRMATKCYEDSVRLIVNEYNAATRAADEEYLERVMDLDILLLGREE